MRRIRTLTRCKGGRSFRLNPTLVTDYRLFDQARLFHAVTTRGLHRRAKIDLHKSKLELWRKLHAPT